MLGLARLDLPTSTDNVTELMKGDAASGGLLLFETRKLPTTVHRLILYNFMVYLDIIS